jgi:hypothetical protein
VTGNEGAQELGGSEALQADEQLDAIATSSLDVSAPAPFTAERVSVTLGEERERWLGDAVAPGPEVSVPPGMTRYLLDLQLQVGERAPVLTFRKAAYVDVGPLVSDGRTASLEISWRAATMAPLFPVFSGRLAWKDGTLHLRGVYAPPGGGVGLIADRLLLNVAARGTARWLLGRAVDAMRRPDGRPAEPVEQAGRGTDED